MHDIRARVRHLADGMAASHRDFAASVGMEPSKLSQSLNNSRRFRAEELASIAERSAVSLEWLLYGAGPTPPLPEQSSEDPTQPVSIRDVRRRDVILEATWRLVARYGYYRVRLSDIAKVCGTSPAALHYHFPSKRDLLQSALLHCAERAFNRQRAELNQIVDAREAFVRLVGQLLPAPGQVQDEWLIWLQVSNESSLRTELRGVHNDFHLRWLDLVAQVIRRGQEQGVFDDTDADRFALGFMSLADGLAIQLLTSTPGNTAETMRSLLLDYAGHHVRDGQRLEQRDPADRPRAARKGRGR
jgi:AcrR family transcriptional regulator